MAYYLLQSKDQNLFIPLLIVSLLFMSSINNSFVSAIMEHQINESIKANTAVGYKLAVSIAGRAEG
jgi:hypothetical protein